MRLKIDCDLRGNKTLSPEEEEWIPESLLLFNVQRGTVKTGVRKTLLLRGRESQ